MATLPSTPLSVTEQLRQLSDARKLALTDVNYYPTIVQGILPIVGPTAPRELRRWGAEFMAEAFAAPAFPPRDKEALSLLVLETLKSMVESDEDTFVARSAVMAASSVYPLVVRWIINNAYDSPTWERLNALKTTILQTWEEALPPVKICCVKFAQRVVLTQTVGIPVEQQLQKRDGPDISLSWIPPNHPLLDPRQLEAEATGLLDRMLGVLQDNSSDALLVDATLNTLSVLVRTRPTTSNRILNSVLNFNPLKLANSPMTPKTRVLVKSMEKTTRMLLIHLTKRDPHNPLAPRIQQYVERMMRSRAEIFDDASRKRPLSDQHGIAYGDAKRQRLGAEGSAAEQAQIPPLGPGPHSLATVFSLTSNFLLQGFDATLVPAPLATKISVATLSRVDPAVFSRAIEGVRARLMSLAAAGEPAALNPDTVPLGVDDDDDDYEPDFYAAEDTEQILNKLDSDAPTEEAIRQEADSLALGTFTLPPPPTIDPEVAAKVGQVAVSRVFGPLQFLEDPSVKRTKAGMNRLAASSYDKDSWLTVIMRLATRSSAGLEEGRQIKSEDAGNGMEVVPAGQRYRLSDAFREALYTYVLENFRPRIEIAVAWLCEEWYCDQLAKRQSQRQNPDAVDGPVLSDSERPLHYETWTLRVVDGFLPYLTPQDKVLTRFLGEIPELSRALLDRVKALCRDPSMVNLALTSLLYLVMMRPPVRELALDTVAGIWLEFEDARPMAAKYLVKWRPGFIESQSSAGAAARTAMTATANLAVPG